MAKSRKKRTYNFAPGHLFVGNQYCYRTKYRRGVHLNKKHKESGPQTVKRLSNLDFKRITKLNQDGRSFRITGTDVCDSQNNVMLLRPKRETRTTMCEKYLKAEKSNSAVDSDGHDEMRLLSPNKVTLMWNKCFKEHENQKFSSCKEVALYVQKENKKGLCWEQRLACKNCSYESSTHKLYDEVKTRTR